MSLRSTTFMITTFDQEDESIELGYQELLKLINHIFGIQKTKVSITHDKNTLENINLDTNLLFVQKIVKSDIDLRNFS